MEIIMTIKIKVYLKNFGKIHCGNSLEILYTMKKFYSKLHFSDCFLWKSQ